MLDKLKPLSSRTAYAFAIVWAFAVLWLYADTTWAMVSIWRRSETFAHGFVVPLISLWLLWRERARIAVQGFRPTAWGLVFTLASGAAWLVGELASVAALSQFALLGILLGGVWALWGHRATWAAAFPLGFLLFCVPFGEFLMPWMMTHTADFTIFALRLSGIPVYREGLTFVVPSGHWSVVEACSGLRYLIASVMVGVLFAWLNYRSAKRRAAFVLASILVPIVANWIRAYLIVMLGHLSGNRLAVGVDHLIYGWVFFGVVIFLLFWVGSKWQEADPATPVAAELARAPHASAQRLVLVGGEFACASACDASCACGRGRLAARE